ncbi:hypothetical protein NC652_022892 [Populus alba x Populus x berolinensis]|nr:hypothetical protein NC652_022892 [Populus alba x Populus x berolinensis]
MQEYRGSVGFEKTKTFHIQKLRHLTISNRLKTNGKAKLVTMTSSIHLPIINPHSRKKPQLVMGGALLCFCYPRIYSEVAVAEMLVQRAAQVNLK